MQSILQLEGLIRLGVFVLVFSGMAIFELMSPRLERAELKGAYKAKRWMTNVSMVVLSAAVLRIVLPTAAIGTAMIAAQNGWGLFNIFNFNPGVAGILSFLLLDLAIWVEHVASHKVPLLWRVHRMHHADTGIDVTTGLRFHPIEIGVSMLWKMAVVASIGAPVFAVLVFEVVLNAAAMFNHSNLRLPSKLDRMLRLVLVTPDMHRVHHSILRDETDSNYGFNLPFWDRLFGTYVDQPKSGHRSMKIGLAEYRDTRPTSILWSLWLPFK